MATTNFQKMFATFAFASLMVLALFSLIVSVQSDNDAAQPLVNNSLFNNSYTRIYQDISLLEGTSDTQYGRFNQEIPKPGFGSIVLFTIVNIGKTFGSIIFTLFALVIKLPLVVLGVDSTITSILISVLTITTVVVLWIVYKFGG